MMCNGARPNERDMADILVGGQMASSLRPAENRLDEIGGMTAGG